MFGFGKPKDPNARSAWKDRDGSFNWSRAFSGLGGFIVGGPAAANAAMRVNNGIEDSYYRNNPLAPAPSTQPVQSSNLGLSPAQNYQGGQDHFNSSLQNEMAGMNQYGNYNSPLTMGPNNFGNPNFSTSAPDYSNSGQSYDMYGQLGGNSQVADQLLARANSNPWIRHNGVIPQTPDQMRRAINSQYLDGATSMANSNYGSDIGFIAPQARAPRER